MALRSLCLTAAAVAAGVAAVPNAKQALEPWAFSPLSAGSVRPLGWLRVEMQAMADGLAGHELEFYRWVHNSRWLFPPGSGLGDDYSGLNEALPYWFNGMVPLAYALDDAHLKEQVHRVAATVLSFQGRDGWLGPERGPVWRNLWGRTPLVLGLVQLAEANATAWDTPVVDGLRRFMRLAHDMLADGGRGFADCGNEGCTWGQVRFADLLISVQWLLEKHPSRRGWNITEDQVLWDIMHMLYSQTRFRWDAWHNPVTYQQVVADPVSSNPLFPYLHAVNAGQGLKSSAVIWRFTHNDSLLETTANGVNWTFKYHGAPSGTILGDEIQRDMAPYMGSELCTAVETGYSLAYLYHALGTNHYADRAELVIYNALPVMLTNDGWGHQYMAQPNGPWASNQSFDQGPLFTTANSGRAMVYGMEPNYPCCAVNYPQGYPKFVTNSWAATENGLVHALLGPTAVRTMVGNRLVTIECQTAYPFENILTYTITASGPFDLYLRVPSWYVPDRSSVNLNGLLRRALNPDPKTGLHRVSIPAGPSTLVYTVGAAVRTETRPRDAVSVYVGNVLYSLDIGQANTSSVPHESGGAPRFDIPFKDARDWYFTSTEPWNVAIDPASLTYHAMPSNGRPLEHDSYREGGGGYVTALGCEIEWPLFRGVAPDVVPNAPRGCVSRPKIYRMIPYGAAKVHMSELPTVLLQMETAEEDGGQSVVDQPEEAVLGGNERQQEVLFEEL